MVTVLHTRRPKARKAHPCEYCGAPAVQPGETYQRDTLVHDGHIYDWVSCKACDALTQIVWAWAYFDEDGVATDQFDEWATEHGDDPEHGKAARAYLDRRGIA